MRNLFVAGTVAVVVHELRDEIQHILLSLSECHSHHCGRIKGEKQEVSGIRSSLGVQLDDAFDGAAADGAETDLVAGEHDAVLLRAVVATCFVQSAFEGPNLASI